MKLEGKHGEYERVHTVSWKWKQGEGLIQWYEARGWNLWSLRVHMNRFFRCEPCDGSPLAQSQLDMRTRTRKKMNVFFGGGLNDRNK